ncbi:MAG TPA: hypothetical protein VFF06_28660 [Polyangia bacterium]|nr:hypothetical protein [Polyangia bacterium]
MPVRFRPDGTVEFDTVDEAVAYKGRVEGQNGVARAERTPPTVSMQERLNIWRRYLEMLGDAQRGALRALKGAGSMPVDELRTMIGVENNNVLSGVLTSVKRNASKAGLDPETVLVRVYDERQDVVSYSAGSLLREMEV